MTRSWRALLTLALGVATWSIVTIADERPVWGSCVASPPQSPYRFTGVVVATTNVDRTARVRTDDGRDVVVLGSDVDGPNAHTSVDRTYQVGVRYEFDPVNDSSPYRDNICTTTHPLADASVVAAPAGGSPHLPGSGGARIAFWATGGLVVVLCLGILGGVARRVRSARR